MNIDMSCNPSNPLWKGCQFEEIGGRFNMTTDIGLAINHVGRNAADIGTTDHNEVTLTGPAPVWAYMVVFHQVVHQFNKVYYNDGRSGSHLVAAHGA